MWRGVNVPVITWVALVVGVWCAAAVGAAVAIGRVIRFRDRQVPRSPQRPVAHGPGAASRAGVRSPARCRTCTARVTTTRCGAAGDHPRGHAGRSASGCVARGIRCAIVRSCPRATVPRSGPASRSTLLDALLAERDGLLSVLDRVLALRGTARLIRDAAGADAGFVADARRPQPRGDPLDRRQPHRLAAGPRRADRAGHRRAGARARASRCGSPTTSRRRAITHQFDGMVRRESMSAMLAVPGAGGARRAGRHGRRRLRRAARRGRVRRRRGRRRAGRRAARPPARCGWPTAPRPAGPPPSPPSASGCRPRCTTRWGRCCSPSAPRCATCARRCPTTRSSARRLGRLESDVSAASLALRESLLALSESSPERALPIELAEHCRSFEARTGVPARFVQLGDGRPARRGAHGSAHRRGARGPAQRREARRGGDGRREPRAWSTAGCRWRSPTTGRPRAAAAEPGDGAGLGLRMLAERAARLGGRVSLVHDEDGGTTLRVLLPGHR